MPLALDQVITMRVLCKRQVLVVWVHCTGWGIRYTGWGHRRWHFAHSWLIPCFQAFVLVL